MSSSSPSSAALESYLRGFDQALQPWPRSPLPADPTLDWWRELLLDPRPQHWWPELQQQLPQLLLQQLPGVSQSEQYKCAVLRGEPIGSDQLLSLPPWECPEDMHLSIAEHPCGAMPVLRTPSWADFERLVRALAHRCEPVPLAGGVHAQAISGLIHWGLIARFGRQARAQLIVLHDAPYGSVPASVLPWDLSEAEWTRRSGDLRLEHELTHLATKRVLGQMRLNLLDELIADAMGLLTTMGCYSAEVFARCLGVDPKDGPQANGRWTSYVGDLDADCAQVVLGQAMQRARELEQILQDLGQEAIRQPRELLPWLCRQQLDRPIQPPTQRC